MSKVDRGWNQFEVPKKIQWGWCWDEVRETKMFAVNELEEVWAKPNEEPITKILGMKAHCLAKIEAMSKVGPERTGPSPCSCRRTTVGPVWDELGPTRCKSFAYLAPHGWVNGMIWPCGSPLPCKLAIVMHDAFWRNGYKWCHNS